MFQLASFYQDPWRQGLAIVVEGIPLILPHDNESDGFFREDCFLRC